MNVGYFAVAHDSPVSLLKMDILKQQRVIKETRFVKRVEFDKPLSILMNGKDRKALIYY